MMKSPISLLALLATASNAYETYHHGVIGHWENVGPCENAELLEPKCAEGSTLCPNKKCTKPGGKCNQKGNGCVDIRWNRDVCVAPENVCDKGFCGTPPDYEDCRCDHDNLCYKVEFWPHHQPDEL
eukprot:g11274.t1 g11274   contig5:506189-506731(+)